jgi:hypothetical protein
VSKMTLASLFLSLSLGAIASAQSKASAEAGTAPGAPRQLMNGTPLPFYVFNGERPRDNHYTPSGWMGDYGDLKYEDHVKLKPRDPHGVIRITYSALAKQGANWAGIYWQNPPNNWGNREGGYNLNGATNLVFKARGAKGSETIAEFKVGGIEGNYRDSGAAAIGPLTLTKAWKQYSISLEGQELSSIAGGFCLTFTRQDNPDGAVVFLDEIRFE